jgi:hypothetical protein
VRRRRPMRRTRLSRPVSMAGVEVAARDGAGRGRNGRGCRAGGAARRVLERPVVSRALLGPLCERAGWAFGFFPPRVARSCFGWSAPCRITKPAHMTLTVPHFFTLFLTLFNRQVMTIFHVLLRPQVILLFWVTC